VLLTRIDTCLLKAWRLGLEESFSDGQEEEDNKSRAEQSNELGICKPAAEKGREKGERVWERDSGQMVKSKLNTVVGGTCHFFLCGFLESNELSICLSFQ
jgi:hypothetical protein